MAKKPDITKQENLTPNPQLVAEESAELAKMIAAIKPASSQQKLMDADPVKQIIHRVTDDSTLEMTTNITSSERAMLLQLAYGYRLSNGNPAVAIRYLGWLKMSKSVSEVGSLSVLEMLSRFMGLSGGGSDSGGFRDKVGRMIAGR